MKNSIVDILGIIDYNSFPSNFEPFVDKEGWTVVLPGEDDGRRIKHGMELIAETKVEIRLKTQSDLLKCIKELEESDRRLRELKVSPPYDWQRVKVRDLVIEFGVSWYDEDFFETRKGIWSSKDHMQLFQKFDVNKEDITVIHKKL